MLQEVILFSKVIHRYKSVGNQVVHFIVREKERLR